MSTQTKDKHECNEAGQPDIDLCPICREHAAFCSICGTSNCCGGGEVSADTNWSADR